MEENDEVQRERVTIASDLKKTWYIYVIGLLAGIGFALYSRTLYPEPPRIQNYLSGFGAAILAAGILVSLDPYFWLAKKLSNTARWVLLISTTLIGCLLIYIDWEKISK